MTPRRRRFAIAAGVLVAVGVVVALILNAFQSNLVFFYSPTQVAQHEAPNGRSFRIGGMVVGALCGAAGLIAGLLRK